MSLRWACLYLVTLSACGGGDEPPAPTPPAVLARIQLTASSTELAPAETATLQATATDSRGQVMSAPSLTWSSSNASIVTVDASGTVSAVSPGTATITAASGTVFGSIALTVVASKISTDAVVVDSTKLTLVSDSTQRANGDLRFTFAGTPPTLSAGKILVGGQDGGFLERVVSTSVQGNQLAVKTTPAAITDVLKAGAASLTMTLDPARGTTMPRLAGNLPEGIVLGAPRIISEPGISARATASGWDLSFFALKGCAILSGVNGCVKLDLSFPRSSINFAPQPKFDWEVDFRGLKHLDVQVGGNLQWDAVAQLDVAFSAAASADTSAQCTLGVKSGPRACPKFVRRLFSVRYPFVLPVGGVPVYGEWIIRFELEGSLVGKGTVASQAPFLVQAPVTAGITIDRGAAPRFTALGPPTANLTASPSVTLAGAAVVLRGTLRPKLELKFYKATSVFVDLEPSISTGLELTSQSTLDFIGKWAIAANLGTSFEIFGKTLASAQFEVAEVGGDLWRRTLLGATPSRLELQPASTSLAIGQWQDLKLIAYAADNSVVTPSPSVTWTSSRPSVAIVDGSGRITAVAAGQAVITAVTANGVQASTRVDVINVVAKPVASVSVSLGSGSISIGQTTQAQAVLRDASGNVLTGRVVTWSSSNPDVASVSPGGVITGVAASLTPVTITATSEGKSGTSQVTVASTCAGNVECEPNDAQATANPLYFSTPLDAFLQTSTDVDWYSLSTGGASTLTVTLTEPARTGPVVSAFSLHGTGGTMLAYSDCGRTAPVQVRLSPAPSQVWVRVSGCGGARVGYRLTVAP